MRVYKVMVAPEASGTVVNVAVKDNQFVHNGDLPFANAARTNALNDLAASAQQRRDQSGVAESAKRRSQGALDQAQLNLAAWTPLTVGDVRLSLVSTGPMEKRIAESDLRT